MKGHILIVLYGIDPGFIVLYKSSLF